MKETPLIEARREYHLAVARFWYEYDAAVEDQRNIRDEALDRGEDPETVWRVYDVATYEARIIFEKAIMGYRRKRHIAITNYRAEYAKEHPGFTK